jgi:hypothetical protein
MADVDRFSERLLDLAKRFADVTDAAQGRGSRSGGRVRARWLVLPATGAGLYALGASGVFMRQAKTVVNQARARASDLPDELLNRVKQAAAEPSGRGANGRAAAQSTSARTGSSRSRSRSSGGRTPSRRRRTSSSSASG